MSKITLEEAQELKEKLQTSLNQLNALIKEAQEKGLSTNYTMSDMSFINDSKTFTGLKQTVTIKI